MLKTILVYVSAIIIMVLVDFLTIPIGMLKDARRPRARKLRRARVIWHLIGASLIHACTKTLAVYLIVLLCHKFGKQPSLAILLIPAFVAILTGIRHITKVREWCRRHGHGHTPPFYFRYPSYALLIGNILGLLIGATLFLRNAPFF